MTSFVDYAEICPARKDVSLRDYTTLRVGGNAKWFFEPHKPEQLAELLSKLESNREPFRLLGGGANSLPSDEGFDGAVIHTGQMRRIFRDGSGLRIWAGATLPAAIRAAAELELSGFEDLIGVPGHIGGALAMNAGSASWGIWDIVENVTLWVPGIVEALNIEEKTPLMIQPRYRNGNLRGAIVLEALFKLEPSSAFVIKKKQEELLRKKNSTQPVTIPSAGCAFVNPPGDSAGRLLERCGMKGVKEGDAEVSEKHANYIINRGQASSKDVRTLIKRMHQAVKENFKIDLKKELVIWD